MAKYFLGSVGKAEAFRIIDGKFELAFVSKTLTDSGLNISTTKDDIRGGTGAPIQFSFYHDTNVEINLTDIQWKHEYLEAQLGVYMNDDDQKAYFTDKCTYEGDNTFTLARQALALPVACLDDDPITIWFAKEGTDDWHSINLQSCEASGDKYVGSFTAEDATKAGLEEDAKYCVRYLAEDSKAVSAEIQTLIVPQELYLIITAPIFAGDSCAASQGKEAGTITFEVPRFQLNGAQEFSMNMSSNQTMSLAGIALASESLECDSVGGKLLRIIEVIYDRADTDYVELVIDEDSCVVGSAPVVYAEKSTGKLVKLDNAKGSFKYNDGSADVDALDSEGKFKAAAATYSPVTITFGELSDEVTVVNA